MDHPTSQTEIGGCAECVLPDEVFRNYDDDVDGQTGVILCRNGPCKLTIATSPAK